MFYREFQLKMRIDAMQQKEKKEKIKDSLKENLVLGSEEEEDFEKHSDKSNKHHEKDKKQHNKNSDDDNEMDRIKAKIEHEESKDIQHEGTSPIPKKKKKKHNEDDDEKDYLEDNNPSDNEKKTKKKKTVQ